MIGLMARQSSRHILITGLAGSGKTHLSKYFSRRGKMAMMQITLRGSVIGYDEKCGWEMAVKAQMEME